MARIKVLLRSKSGEQNLFEWGSIRLDTDAHVVTKQGKPVALTQKEFALLEFLLRNKGKVCRRSRIIEKIWDIQFEKDTSVIDVFINSLRKKLDSGIYLDHAIETIAESLAETLNEEGFIIIHKAEKENGRNLRRENPSTLSYTSH